MRKDNLTKELVDNHGFTKWEIKKLVGVSWNTVHLWYIGAFEPTNERREALNEVYKGVKEVI